MTRARDTPTAMTWGVVILSMAVNLAGLELLNLWHPYPFGSLQGNDFFHEALPVYRDLAHGHLRTAIEIGPSYLGSVLVRAPFVLPALWLGASGLTAYLCAAGPCLCAGPLLALWLARRGRIGQVRAAQLPLLFIVLNPVTLSCLTFGHPEDILTATLAIAAVICAADGDCDRQAGALLAAAVICKPWAVVAVPVVFAVGGLGRAKCAWFILLMVAFWGPVLAIHVLAAGGSGISGSVSAPVGNEFNPPQLLYSFDSNGWLVQHAHLLIVLVPVPIAGVWRLTHRGTAPRDLAAEGLWLLSLMLFIRFAFDPWDQAYYPLPFLMALMSIRSRWMPLLGFAASIVSFTVNSPHMDASSGLVAGSHIFALVALPVLAALILRTLVPPHWVAWFERRSAGLTGHPVGGS